MRKTYRQLELSRSFFCVLVPAVTDLWKLEVIQPMRERNPDSLMEESYAPHLRESLLEEDDVVT